jgi:hypothetical protein
VHIQRPIIHSDGDAISKVHNDTSKVYITIFIYAYAKHNDISKNRDANN